MNNDKQLLVVEDDPQLGRALARQLRREHDNVVLAGSAKQALFLLESLGGEGGFFAIISDHDLGRGKNGEQFLLEVAERYPRILRYGMSGDPRNWYSVNDGLVRAVWDKGDEPQMLVDMVRK